MTPAESWAAAPRSDGPLVLAIESSCDETAAAVLDGTRSRVLAEAHNRLVVQMAVLHRLLAR